jgi:hypothetical protein
MTTHTVIVIHVGRRREASSSRSINAIVPADHTHRPVASTALQQIGVISAA